MIIIDPMDQRIYHGKITPSDLAQTLVATFNRGNLRVQQIGSGDKISVQIATAQANRSGGKTALSVYLLRVEDGVAVQVGSQAWLGIAASLGFSALNALRNPWTLIDRIDDIAQDMESIQLSEEIWSAIESSVRALGGGFELSNRLRRLTCSFCGVANPIGQPSCVACGAPLGALQPTTCSSCGFVSRLNEKICPNCGKPFE